MAGSKLVDESSTPDTEYDWPICYWWATLTLGSDIVFTDNNAKIHLGAGTTLNGNNKTITVNTDTWTGLVCCRRFKGETKIQSVTL